MAAGRGGVEGTGSRVVASVRGLRRRLPRGYRRGGSCMFPFSSTCVGASYKGVGVGRVGFRCRGRARAGRVGVSTRGVAGTVLGGAVDGRMRLVKGACVSCGSRVG